MITTATWTCWRDAGHPVAPHPLFGWPQCTECGAGPQYWERKPADTLSLNLYVPTPTSRFLATLVPGSAIVGVSTGERILIHFEGFKYGTPEGVDRENHLQVWRAGLEQAADRLVTQYPTVATAHVLITDLTKVGTYTPSTGRVELDNLRLLMAWLEKDR